MSPLQAGTAGDHEQKRRGPRYPDQHLQQVAGGPVRPLQVVDQQRDRPLRAELPQQRREQVEQPRLGIGALLLRILLGKQAQQPVHARQQPPQRVGPRIVHQAAEHRDDRRQRQPLGAQLHAGGAQHPHAGRAEVRGGLVQEPCLAHPGRAGHQHRPRLPAPRVPGGAFDGVQQRPSPHERCHAQSVLRRLVPDLRQRIGHRPEA